MTSNLFQQKKNSRNSIKTLSLIHQEDLRTKHLPMITFIEELIRTKTGQKKSQILFTQWQVSKEYLPRVLELISHTFPHYSLHDKTHADAIINNITRILGKETIQKMSAIDLWLLLSASYYHDIGMSIDATEKMELFESTQFAEFLKDKQNDLKSPIQEYAQLFEIKDNKVYYRNKILSAQSYEAPKFLIAEYIRATHGERSQQKIQSEKSLQLPGSAIPSRLIGLLSSICEAHTKSFETVMTLPLVQTGIDEEDCHPRFIACLLRLGDLLDLDNNRFSEVLLHSLSSIPFESLQHKEKHMAIKHLQVDKCKIEIKAICDTYDVADLTNRWFLLLNDEVSRQMKRWNDIVPSSDFGYLPTLGDLAVELKGYDTIDGKLRPSFGIDPQKAIELLQGTGLYNEPYQCLRELLQNAVDTTLLRIFTDYKRNEKEIDKAKFSDISKNYPITVKLKKTDNGTPRIKWSIEISDNGMGMSKDDLIYLTNTGSSYKNKEKQRIIEQMPEWMKPSGTFGIGFQSVFLLSSQVNIITRKLNHEKYLDVALNDPAGIKDGAILIKSLYNDDIPIGTCLQFEKEVDREPNSWHYNWSQNTTGHTINSFDFIEDSSLDIEIGKIIDEITTFNETSGIPIRLWLDVEEITLPKTHSRNMFQHYDEERGLEFSLRTSDYRSRVYYRGQIVDNNYSGFNFLSFDINIVAGNAKNILTLNRNEIQSSFKHILSGKIIDAACQYIGENYVFFTDEELKIKACMFLKNYTDDTKIPNDWESYQIVFSEDSPIPKLSLAQILTQYDCISFSVKNGHDYYTITATENDSKALSLVYDRSEVIEFLKAQSTVYFKYISYEKDNKSETKRTIHNNKKRDVIKDWEQWFTNRLLRGSNSYARIFIPGNKKYKALFIEKTCGYEGTFNGFHQEYPIMVCPYVKKYTKGDNTLQELSRSTPTKLFDYVYEHRLDKTVTKEDIAKTYDLFVKDTEKIIAKINTELKNKKSSSIH